MPRNSTVRQLAHTPTPLIAPKRELDAHSSGAQSNGELPSMQRTLASPLSASPAQLLQLQQRLGNRTVSNLVQRAHVERTQAPTIQGAGQPRHATGLIQRLPIYIADRGVIETTTAKWAELEQGITRENIKVVVGYSSSRKSIMRPPTDAEWGEIEEDCKVAKIRHDNGTEKDTVGEIKDFFMGLGSSINEWGQKTFASTPDGKMTRQSQTIKGAGHTATAIRMPGTIDSIAQGAQSYLGVGGQIAEQLSSLDPTSATSAITLPLSAGQGIQSHIASGKLENIMDRKKDRWCSPALGKMMPQLLEWKKNKARRSAQATAGGSLALAGLALGGLDMGLTSIAGLTLGPGALAVEKGYGYVKHGAEDDELPDDKRKRFAFEILREARHANPQIRAEATVVIQSLGLSISKLLDEDKNPLPGAEDLLIAEMASW